MHDPVLMPGPSAGHFYPEAWGDRVSGRAQGRGSAVFLNTPKGRWVLRQYLRGGLPAKFSRRYYWWRGRERSRAAREFRLLQSLRDQGFAVPEPVAVAVWRHGLWYRAAILMREIPGPQSLADLLADAKWSLEPELDALWACLQRFQQAGVWHADLNARNILRDAEGQWHLIDWDRGRLDAQPQQCQANLARLARSLRKIASEEGWPAGRAQPLLDRIHSSA